MEVFSKGGARSASLKAANSPLPDGRVRPKATCEKAAPQGFVRRRLCAIRQVG